MERAMISDSTILCDDSLHSIFFVICDISNSFLVIADQNHHTIPSSSYISYQKKYLSLSVIYLINIRKINKNTITRAGVTLQVMHSIVIIINNIDKYNIKNKLFDDPPV